MVDLARDLDRPVLAWTDADEQRITRQMFDAVDRFDMQADIGGGGSDARTKTRYPRLQEEKPRVRSLTCLTFGSRDGCRPPLHAGTAPRKNNARVLICLVLTRQKPQE